MLPSRVNNIMADRALWTIDALLRSTGGTLHGIVDQSLNGVSIDSRSVASGDIFVAIKGESHDGHAFVARALQAGAGVAIVSRTEPYMLAAGPVVAVSGDPLQALERLGCAARLRSTAQIIAITGSVGKTSTKEMLRVALEPVGRVHASVASFNNHWGVPLTLSRMAADTEFGIFEIGMNHAGEITPLVSMVQPHVAIVTTVAASHLGHFKSLDEIAEAKAEIFSGVVRGGGAIINRDTPYFDFLKAKAKERGIAHIVSFGRHGDADVRIENIALHPDCSTIAANAWGTRIDYRLGIPGEHMAVNSLAAIGAAKLAGADLTKVVLALSQARPAKGRGVQEWLFAPDGGKILLIDESYNANPASMRAAFALLANSRPGKGGRRIAVVGDMLELGEFAPLLHEELASVALEQNADMVFAVGPLMLHLWDKVPLQRRGLHAATSELLKDKLLGEVRPGDVIMIKGSLGSRMGLLADAFRKRFSASNRENA